MFNKNIKEKLSASLDFLESGMSILVLFGLIMYLVNSFGSLRGLDWANIETFYFFINYILALVVGIELAKLMITHDIFAITNLLTFVVARKLLKPDLGALEILLGILAFALLFVLNYFGKYIINKTSINPRSVPSI